MNQDTAYIIIAQISVQLYEIASAKNRTQKRRLIVYQQNSNLHGGVHVICMHPWFFSIGRLHLGQGFELASILKPYSAVRKITVQFTPE